MSLASGWGWKVSHLVLQTAETHISDIIPHIIKVSQKKRETKKKNRKPFFHMQKNGSYYYVNSNKMHKGDAHEDKRLGTCYHTEVGGGAYVI
jgi:hypothetical protein